MILSELPAAAGALLLDLQPAFTRRTWCRFAPLMAGLLLAMGLRPVANLLRTVDPLAEGLRSGYQRPPIAHRSGLRLAPRPVPPCAKGVRKK
jgi:hypothetical protein